MRRFVGLRSLPDGSGGPAGRPWGVGCTLTGRWTIAATRSRSGRDCGPSVGSSASRSRRSRPAPRGVQGVGAGCLRAGRAGDLGGPPPAAGPALLRAGRPAAAGGPGAAVRARGPATARPASTVWAPTSRTPPPIRIDLTALDSSTHPQAELLGRFVRLIQVQRGDFNGQVVTVRRSDHGALGLHPRRRSRGGLGSPRRPRRALRPRPPVAADFRSRPPADTMGRCPPRSASTSTCRSARPGATTARSRRWTDRHHLTDAYLAACRADADRLVAAGLPEVTSVFVGGGTPSMVPAAELVRVLDRVPRAPGCEVTVECNPDTVTEELVDTYLAGGVTRLSFGVQSTSAHVLAALGRTHDRANVERSVELARRGRSAHLQPRRHLRRRRRVPRGLVPHARRRARPRPAARLRVRAHGRGGDGAGRRSRPPPRR